MKTLKETKIGETVKIVKLHGEGAVKRRIMDMGLPTRNAFHGGEKLTVNLHGSHEWQTMRLF